MSVKIIQNRISKGELLQIASETFVTMVKAVVDAEKGILALGGDLHADGEVELLKTGSKQEDLWGINIYPDQPIDKRIEYISLINIRPHRGNQTMEVEDQGIRDKIKEVIDNLVE